MLYGLHFHWRFSIDTTRIVNVEYELYTVKLSKSLSYLFLYDWHFYLIDGIYIARSNLTCFILFYRVFKVMNNKNELYRISKQFLTLLYFFFNLYCFYSLTLNKIFWFKIIYKNCRTIKTKLYVISYKNLSQLLILIMWLLTIGT